MNNQELQNRSNMTEEVNVNKRRRFLKSAGAVAPVILTLSSPSVLGGTEQCLSQQMSGNLSNHPGSCVKGNNLQYWQSPANADSWTKAGLKYGTFQQEQGQRLGQALGKVNKCGKYTGGTSFNDVFHGDGRGRKSMQEILCEDEGIHENNPSEYSCFIGAMLNARTVSGYILTETQVKGIFDGTTQVPGGDVKAFLLSTW